MKKPVFRPSIGVNTQKNGINNPKKAGRPQIKIDPQQVEELAARGLSQRQICDCIGISDETFMKRRKKSLDLLDSFTRGRAQGLALVADELLKSVKDRNVQAQMFYLRCHGGEQWVEKQGDLNVNISKNESKVNAGLAAVLNGTHRR